MSKGLIGKKLGMSSVFTPEGRYVGVTVVEVGPCVVSQVKTREKDGYNALQLAFDPKKEARINKPIAGHLKKCGGYFAHLKEMPVDNPGDFNVGSTIGLEIFKVGEHVDVVGTMKGRGFSGAVKRHGFHGGSKTHGAKSQRATGSIGCSATPAKVIRGKKMPGQYGNTRKTVRNLEIIDIRPDENLILIKGAIPGSRSGLVEIKKLKFVK